MAAAFAINNRSRQFEFPQPIHGTICDIVAWGGQQPTLCRWSGRPNGMGMCVASTHGNTAGNRTLRPATRGTFFYESALYNRNVELLARAHQLYELGPMCNLFAPPSVTFIRYVWTIRPWRQRVRNVRRQLVLWEVARNTVIPHMSRVWCKASFGSKLQACTPSSSEHAPSMVGIRKRMAEGAPSSQPSSSTEAPSTRRGGIRHRTDDAASNVSSLAHTHLPFALEPNTSLGQWKAQFGAGASLCDGGQ